MNNRIYKFRAWDKEERKWKLGYKELGGFHLLGELNLLGEVNAELASPLSKLQDIEIMQYTGRKDKNRKGIYEGDILKVKIPNYTHDYVEAEVKFNSGCFGIEVIGNPILNNAVGQFKAFSKNTKNIEVIGNVWENPELYEENK